MFYQQSCCLLHHPGKALHYVFYVDPPPYLLITVRSIPAPYEAYMLTLVCSCVVAISQPQLIYVIRRSINRLTHAHSHQTTLLALSLLFFCYHCCDGVSSIILSSFSLSDRFVSIRVARTLVHVWRNSRELSFRHSYSCSIKRDNKKNGCRGRLLCIRLTTTTTLNGGDSRDWWPTTEPCDGSSLLKSTQEEKKASFNLMLVGFSIDSSSVVVVTFFLLSRFRSLLLTNLSQ